MIKPNRFIGAILLIAGTAIGAGMLALPVSTAAYGFLPSALLFFGCWALLTFTALLILEVNLWLNRDANIISMANQTLGYGGRAIAWLTYLLLLYSLVAAYLTSLDNIVNSASSDFLHFNIYNGAGSLIPIFVVSAFIYFGTASVDYLNRIFITGKALTYLALVFLITKHINIQQLTASSYHKMWYALPIIFTSFGFHTIIPALRRYLNDDIKQLRHAILIGSVIPLIIYLIWEAVIVGVVPKDGKDGLLTILHAGDPATDLAVSLKHLLNNNLITSVFKYFSFFGISTSFIGVTYSLFGFIADGFKIKYTMPGKLLSLSLTFLPPLIFALFYPKGFIFALGYAGIFVAILLGLLPVLMAWRGRYHKNFTGKYQVAGGKWALAAAIIILIFIIAIQVIPQ